MQRLTPVEYSNVKTQLRTRAAGGWARVAWSLARRPQLHELELVHARLMSINPKARLISPACWVAQGVREPFELERVQPRLRSHQPEFVPGCCQSG